MNEKYELRFITLPDFVYRDKRHTATSLKVYGFINSYRGRFFGFGNQEMARMFDVSEWTISQAISKLVLLGYIKVSYKIKADGGKTRLVENLKSDIGVTQSPTLVEPNDKENNIKKIIKEREERHLSFLINLPENLINELTKRFEVSPKQVRSKAEDLHNYCQAKGKTYKDYRAFLVNAVKSDFKERVVRPRINQNLPEMPEEQRLANLKMLSEKRAQIGL